MTCPLDRFRHGYLAQEGVNLLLTGRATSGVGDGVADIGGLRLRGVNARARVGLLTLHEARRVVARCCSPAPVSGG